MNVKKPLAAVAGILAAALLLAAEGSVGGIRWTVPARWTTAPAKPMRAVTYVVPAAPGQEAGECGVFFFGKGQGGSVDENLARWAAQFESGTKPATSARTINGLSVHETEISGTYLAPGGPMMQSQGKKTGWQLVGAIVEAPDGLVFFKCTGPAATIAGAKKDFEALVKSFSKASKA